MKMLKHPRVKPLVGALALTFFSGAFAPLSIAGAPSIRAEYPVPTATANAGPSQSGDRTYTQERRLDRVSRSQTAHYSSEDENGRARYIVILKEAPLASYAGETKGYASIPNQAASSSRSHHKDSQSVQAKNYITHLQSVQHAFTNDISARLGRQIEPVRQYQHALNGMAVDLTPEEADELRQHADVLMVNREQVRKLLTYDTPRLIGAKTIWEGTSTPPPGLSAQGEGMVIGEIDSGINWRSHSMQTTGSDGYSVVNPLGSGIFLGNCLASGTIKNGYTSRGRDVSHCNDKLIGIYNLENNNISGQDLDGHGTHTASTAGGNHYSSAPFLGATFNLSGIAPHANVIAYLACGDDVSKTTTCADTGLAGAVNQAVADNIVDAINYSIGGPEASPWGDTIQMAFLNATDAGIFVATAAGNDGPAASSITGNEAPWTTTVAATTPAKTPAIPFTLTAPVSLPALSVITGSAPYPQSDPTQPDFVSLDNLPLIESPGFADGSNDGCSAFAPNTFSRAGVGGIAVLHFDQNTSTCGSIARRSNAAGAGATAVVYVDEQFIGLAATGATYSLRMSDWLKIKQAVADVSTTGAAQASLGLTAAQVPRTPDDMADFSSRGPVPFANLKPDISAPGDFILAAMSPTVLQANGVDVDIAATNALYAKTDAASIAQQADIYGTESGTSMATPHITGSAILVRQIHPTWTPMQVKSALMTTAAQVKTEDDSSLADPNSAGAGRVDLSVATRVGLLFDETKANFIAANPATGGKPETLNIASFYHFDCTQTCTFPRTVSSALDHSSTWTIGVSGLPLAAYSLDKGSFTLAAGAQTSFQFSINALNLLPGQWYYGQLTLVSNDPSLPVQRLPIAIRPSTAKLRSDTTSITARALTGWHAIKTVNVSNAGNPTLNWSFSGTHLPATIVNRLVNTSSGVAVRTVDSGTAITSTNASNAYAADYFDIFGTGTKITNLSMSGFNNSGALPDIASQVAWRVYASDATNSKPNGRPGIATDPAALFTYQSAPIAVGTTYAGDDVQLDLAAAGTTSPALASGRYWLSMAATVSSTSSAAAWNWLYSSVAGKTPAAQLVQPNSTNATLKQYRAATTATGLAMRVDVDAACGASWLTYSAQSGSLGLSGSTAVTLDFDATALAAGTYTAYACLTGNGTSPANALTGDTDSILIPVTFTVVTPPATPVCTATPSSSRSTGLVTIKCTGASTGTTNTVLNSTTNALAATCTLSGTTINCPATSAGTLGANPTVVTKNAAGDSVSVVVALSIDDTAPATPTCTAVPSVAKSTASVVVTCTGVETGSTNSFPTVACTPNPATGTSVTCTGTASNFGANPTFKTTDAVGNITTTVVSLAIDDTAPAIPVCTAIPSLAQSTTLVAVTCTGVEPGTTNTATGSVICTPDLVGDPTGATVICNATGGTFGANPIVTSTDVAGNSATTGPIALIIDDTAPAMPTCIAAPSVAQSTASVTITCTGIESGTTNSAHGVNCTVAAGTAQCTASAATFGANPTFTTTDGAGNATTAPVALVIDDTAPAAPVCTATPNLAQSTVSVSISCTVEAGTANSVNGVACTTDPGTPTTAICTGLAADFASNPLAISTDAAGNTASSTVALTVDDTAPALPTCTATPNPAADVTAVTISCTAAELGAAISFASANVVCTPTPADATGEVNCTGTGADFGVDPLLSITDGAGNTATENVTLAIDNTPPAALTCTAAPNPAKSTTLVTIGCTGAGAGSTNTVTGANCAGPIAGDPMGTVTCTGAAGGIGGNPTLVTTSTLGLSTPVQVSLTIDDLAPVAPTTCVAVPNVARSAASVTITCTDVEAGTTNAVNGVPCTTDPSDATGQTVTCTSNAGAFGANPSLISTDAAGNASAPAVVALTIDDSAPGALSCTASPNLAQSTATVTITCNGAEAGTTNTVGTVACTPSPATSGALTCSATAGTFGANPTAVSTDVAGNTSSVTTVVLMIDDTAPATPACTASPNPTRGTAAVTITCAGGEAGTTNSVNGAICAPTDASGGITCIGPGSTIGNDPSLISTDVAGNASAPAAIALTIDNTAPAAPTCTAAPNPAMGTANVDVSCNGVEVGSTNVIGSVACTPDPATGTSVTCSAIGNVFGSNPILVTTDRAGNSTPASVVLTIDNTPPPSPLCVATPNPAMGTATVTIGCTGAEVGSTNSVNGATCTAPTAAGALSCTGTGAAIGDNPVLISTDAAGNVGQPVAIALVIDSTAPLAPVCTAAPNPANNAAPVTIACSGVESGTTNTVPGATCAASGANGLTCTGTGGSLGANPKLTSTDLAGNSTLVTVALTLDNTPPPAPQCIANPASASGTTTVTITCNVEAGTANAIPGTTCTPDPATGGTVVCTGMASAIGSNPTASSMDAAGNSSTAAVAFTLLAVADPTASTLACTPATSQTVGSTFTCTVTALDTGSNPVTGAVFNTASAAGSTASAATCTTDSSGLCSFTVSSAAAGSYGVTAQTGTTDISGSPAVVEFTAAGGQPNLLSVVSRKKHGNVGTFDIPLSLTAAVDSSVLTSEPRLTETGGVHRLVFTFDAPVTSVGGVQLGGKSGSTLATGTAGTPVITGNSVAVSLTGVADRKRLQVTLTDINGVSGANASVAVGYLFGDVTRDRQVTGIDAVTTAAASPAPATATNFVFNVSLSGTINALDKALVSASSPKALE